MIGIIPALILTWLFKKSKTINSFPVKETCLITLTGYLSYSFSEIFHFSGILALFSSGMIMSYYT